VGRRFHLLLLILTVVANGCQPGIAQSLTGGTPGSADVDFELFHDYLIVLHGRVGPLDGLNFLLDTGATPSVLDPALAQKLGLHSTPIEIAVLQGTARGGTVTLPSLQIGPVGRSNFPVLLEDLSFIQKVLPVHIDGIVGLDVRGQRAFVIDYAARQIHFGASDLTSSVPLEINHGLAIVTARVNHHSTQLLLDTGAPSLMLFRSLNADTRAQLISPDSIGNHEQDSLRLASLILGPATIRHPSAFLISSRNDTEREFAGILSPAGLGFRRVGIDLHRGAMAFSR